MIKRLHRLKVEINTEEQREADNYHGEVYYYPMLTE